MMTARWAIKILFLVVFLSDMHSTAEPYYYKKIFIEWGKSINISSINHDYIEEHQNIMKA